MRGGERAPPQRVLRGLTWDHPRGYDCLAANVPLFEADHPGVAVAWERRSLKAFGEEPLETLADRYDLIVVDHPFAGRAAAAGCLRDLRPLLGGAAVDDLVGGSVGPSGRSYALKGQVLALPTDAAAQVASYRPDLLRQIGVERPPRTFPAVIALAERARAHGLAVATPACPTDAICLLLSYAANIGDADLSEEAVFEPRLLNEALARAAQVASLGDPRALDWNPIQTYEAMGAENGIVYVPLAFGYSNYARLGRHRPILAADFAGPGADPARGSVLGGAGIAVTASARHLDAVAAYLRWVHRPEHQSGPYFDRGGQPGSGAAWQDGRVNALSHNFFRDTAETLEKAYVRPRFDGFVPFLKRAGVTVHRHLRGDLTRSAALTDLLDDFDRSRHAAPTPARRMTERT